MPWPTDEIKLGPNIHGTFLHNTHAQLIWPNRVKVKAPPVIAQTQEYPFWPVLQRYPYMARSGVLEDIIERLLRNAIEGDLCVNRQPLITFNSQRSGYLGLARHRLKQLLQQFA